MPSTTRLVTLTASTALMLVIATGAEARSFNTIPPMPDYASTTAMPAEHDQQGVVYLTGGIGDEERMTIEEASRDYNLRITNVDKEGAFAGDSYVTIYDSKGNQVAAANSGPLFYIALPAGKYTIASVDANEVQKKKTVTVGKNKATETTIVW